MRLGINEERISGLGLGVGLVRFVPQVVQEVELIQIDPGISRDWASVLPENVVAEPDVPILVLGRPVLDANDSVTGVEGDGVIVEIGVPGAGGDEEDAFP